MSVYAIGDIQGCYDALRALLDKLKFDPDKDTLWFAGDLVNRGPQSLQTLRYVKSLGKNAITVLGNHDLHLLAVDAGVKKKTADLKDILEAPDRRELIDWLRQQPLLHHDPALGYTMVHAGLSPQWNLIRAQACAHELESVLRGDDYREFLKVMYGDRPRKWHWWLRGKRRLRYICNCFTRIRYCSRDGKLALSEKGAPGSQPEKFMPWFDVPNRANQELTLIFGHWSTLGAYQAPGIYALDTGCVWGGSLTALELTARPAVLHSVECTAARNPYDFV
ncbi:MAG: symmetrical bis(5'-nucleosyl)-tetraphosphatase [Gammaproteobacteria bacterium]